MNELEMKKLWQTTYDKLEENFVIHKKNTMDITKVKIHSILDSMKPIKIFTLLIGILWVGIGAIVLSEIYTKSFSGANKFFLFSATFQVLLTAAALLFYIYQLTKIYKVEVYDSILTTQKKLAQLKISTLWATRIMFLQLPLWTTFYWNESMLENGNWFLWIIQGLVTLSFTYAALWLFFNIKLENKDKKWFDLLFKGKEWTPLMKSMELLKQIDAYTESEAEHNPGR